MNRQLTDHKKQDIRQNDPEHDRVSILRKILVLCIWSGLIILCLVHRDKITIESIVSFTPEAPIMAALIMLCLFALKSVTFFIYGGLLYAASGILFPLPTAILVNVLGTVVMTSIPFLIGKKSGSKAMARLIRKNPKLELLQELPSQNELFISFLVRIIGLLPSDLVGMCLGASGIRYSRYLCGTLLGMLPTVISVSVMGMSADDVTSPAFIISLCFEAGLIILSICLYVVWKRRQRKTSTVSGRGGKIYESKGKTTHQHSGNAG